MSKIKSRWYTFFLVFFFSNDDVFVCSIYCRRSAEDKKRTKVRGEQSAGRIFCGQILCIRSWNIGASSHGHHYPINLFLNRKRQVIYYQPTTHTNTISINLHELYIWTKSIHKAKKSARCVFCNGKKINLHFKPIFFLKQWRRKIHRQNQLYNK